MTIYAGASDIPIQTTIKNELTGAPEDLTGATVTIWFRLNTGAAVTATATIAIPETNGIVNYTLPAAAFATKGKLDITYFVTLASGAKNFTQTVSYPIQLPFT